MLVTFEDRPTFSTRKLKLTVASDDTIRIKLNRSLFSNDEITSLESFAKKVREDIRKEGVTQTVRGNVSQSNTHMMMQTDGRKKKIKSFELPFALK